MGSELRVMCCRMERNGWGKRGGNNMGGRKKVGEKRGWEEEREIKGKRGGVVVKSNLGGGKKI